MSITVPEGFRKTDDRNFIRPKRFDTHNFSNHEVIPPIYSNVTETMKQFPGFASCEKGVVLYSWCYNTGFNNVYNIVQRSPQKEGEYFASMATASGMCPGVERKELVDLAKVFKANLKEQGLSHKRVKVEDISFNLRKDKKDLISPLKIDDNFSFGVFGYGSFGIAVLAEGPTRKFPSTEDIENDILGVAKIGDVARPVFSEYLAKNSPWCD